MTAPSRMRLFVSSVQKEMAAERLAVKSFVEGDVLLRRFFEVFLFEDLPASDRHADEVYLGEVNRCPIYVGIFGCEYGVPDTAGLSPTHREFDRATAAGKDRFIFVKGSDDALRQPQMAALVRQAGSQLIRRRFGNVAELIPALYASLVDYLADKQLIRSGPWDAAPCLDASVNDLSADKIQRFVSIARRARAFPLAEETDPAQVMEHLNLLKHSLPTHAAVLLFGTAPQRFMLPSEVKCAHFHGTVVRKPIPSHQVYKGTVFELVDQAVDFVLSKVHLSVGTRALSTQAPVEYEIPPEVVREAIVNAVAHRDYTSNASVQVMLFADRLEIWNPGTLPPSLTLEKLRHPHASVPANPLLAESLYLAKYIERMGTGTGDMIDRCRAAGLPEPEFKLTDGFLTTIRRKHPAGQVAPPVAGEVSGQVAGQVTGQVTGQVEGWIIKALLACQPSPLSSRAIQAATGFRHRETFQRNYLDVLLKEALLERTLPDKPNSRLQKYRLTAKGRAVLLRHS